MFRTEVIKTKNFRKSVAYKAFNGFAIVVVVAIFLFTSNILGEESNIAQFIKENYTNIIQPVFYGLALVIFVVSMLFRNSAKSPKRLGTIELDENELKYLEEDELKATIALDSIESIGFEFFSFRMRGNPMGGMNYLTLLKNGEEKTFEIVIANSLVKAEFGDLLNKINTKTPVKVTYTYWMKKIFKDSDFKFD